MLYKMYPQKYPQPGGACGKLYPLVYPFYSLAMHGLEWCNVGTKHLSCTQVGPQRSTEATPITHSKASRGEHSAARLTGEASDN